MKLTESAVKNPAAIGVIVAIITLFGLFSLFDLPVQLFPEIELPQMSINANWRAASPAEIESEILEPMEEVLQGLPGLKTLEANANPGGVWINLQFGLGTDMDATLMDIIGRLNRLPPLPADADPPVIQMGGWGGGPNQALTWYFVQKLPDTPGDIESYSRQVKDIIEPALERIEGVAGVDIQGGPPEELQITVDPYRAAQLGLPLTTIAQSARRSNDVSGGFVDVGRRTYTLRFEGKYEPEQMRHLIIDWRNEQPVRLGDVADVEVRRGTRNGLAVQNGNPAMGIRIDREAGANVLATLTEVKTAIDELRPALGDLGLAIEQSFDASVFINRAVGMVRSNLLIGILLAIGVLWWFLRDRRATLLIATAIPISLLTTFIVLSLTGRSLNVISLAGLAFAVGMVLDAAIVVSENIVRLRERGEVPTKAALSGATQVRGALLASTATTVAIFIPVLFLKNVEGQLFADLALTIAIAVIVSFLVAVTILPAVASSWLKPKKLSHKYAPRWANMAKWLMRISATPVRRWGIIGGLLATPLLITWLLFPQLDYLPPVKRDAVDAFMQTPPGASWETLDKEVVSKIVDRMQPYMDGEKQPALKNYYILLWPGGGTIGARVIDQNRVKELEEIIRDQILVGIPDFRGFASQGNLFGGFGGGRNIALHIQSTDTEALYAAAAAGQAQLWQTFPGANVQSFPPPELATPELRLTPNDERINEAGWDRQQVASMVRAMGNGLWLGEHFDGDKRLDIILRADGWDTPEQLMSIPVTTPAGNVTPLGELVTVRRATGPGTIRRVNGRRTVSLNVSPPENMSLETALEQIKTEIEPALAASLPADGTIQYGGSADSLAEAIATMSKNFLLALLLLFMLMAGLFRSLKDAALVILTIPLATVGGIIAIRVLNIVTFQPMDLLTMIGFIILLGLVVNNAILLVDQTRQAERNGMPREQAVEHALTLRLRPIFMSTLTSIFGMLPLLLMPGIGSVIYRGLSAVIVGGMAFSLLFTLLLLPSLLRIGHRKPAPEQNVHTPLERNLESVA